MSELIQLTKELRCELNKMTVEELKGFRETWLQELERKNDLITDFYMNVIDGVITDKEDAGICAGTNKQ